MDKGAFLIETHLRTGRPIKELAKAHGVSPSWLFKLLARYRRDGEAGLEPRSRRPKRSPARISTNAQSMGSPARISANARTSGLEVKPLCRRLGRARSW